MKKEIPMNVLETRVKKAVEEMENELKVEGKEPGWCVFVQNSCPEDLIKNKVLNLKNLL